MKDIAILDCPEIGAPPVMMYVFPEMCTAFADKGFKVRICKQIAELTNNDIVFMGDVFQCEDPELLLYNQAPDAIYIGWYWHTINIKRLRNFIYTHENALNEDERIQMMKRKGITCPMPLRAADSPSKIGTYPRQEVYDYCYIGPWAYNRDLRPTQFHGFVHDNYGVENFLDYDTRRNIYLSSKLALAFQSDWNIEYKHVSQRVYEALAYGCVTFSNSISATEQTNGIVVHVTSKEDLELKMDYYLQHPEEVEKKRQLGYEFIRKCGTNHYTADLFLNTIMTHFLTKSQARQDEFVYRILSKTNGTFFDIGSQNPIDINNTYALEQLGWSGYLFDINPGVSEITKASRKSKFTLTDVSTFDWDTFLTENNLLNTRIDYLSFDVDEASLSTMRRFPFDKVSFNVCTIEHDRYRFGQEVADEMRNIMHSYGYSIVCKDVTNLNQPYEDWYVHKDLVCNLYYENMEWSDILKNIRNSSQ